MPIRTGQQYLDNLNAHPREIWIQGERVESNAAEHPAFRGVAGSLAGIYDLQHQPDLEAALTFPSPQSGEPVSVMFIEPRTIEDLKKRSAAMKCWAEYSGGMLGRTADHLSVTLMAMAAAADYFSQQNPMYGENIRKYFAYVRENDLLLTHTLINPQANRSVGVSDQKSPTLAARVTGETEKGIVVRGARLLATLAPVTDELLVLPSTLLRTDPADAPYAFAFAIPCDTPGVRFLCRDSLDYGRSHFDHPLGSRFDESDAIVIFDGVLVPWDRVFMTDRPDLCNRMHMETGALAHMTLQAAIKNIAKLEFMLGTVLLMAETIAIEGFQHVQEKLAEVMVAVETARALVSAAEAEAKLNQWGVMAPEMRYLFAARLWFPKIYPRIAEIVQLLGASGLMALPSEADLHGPLEGDVEQYLQAACGSSEDRIGLFRLAWDLSCSGFAGRQILYERFFFGDPVRVAGSLFQWYDKEPYKARVREFLARGVSAPKG